MRETNRDGCVGEMTADRATYFLERFKREEKLLGPHEQWALDFAIAALSPLKVEGPSVKESWLDNRMAVKRFAVAMEDKLDKKADEGRGGWSNKEECSQEDLSLMLRKHVEKGDPIDVANFCMMLFNRGERIIHPRKILPSQELLLERLNYDPETGKLYRNTDGKEAFTFTDRQGYRHGKINDVKYQAHRIIWKLVHGHDPIIIDHINGDQGDNRISNLRSCTIAENSRNYHKPGGSSKYRGVCWTNNTWVAGISNGKGGRLSLGSHKDEVEAAKAYDVAARRLHGDFAVLNFPNEV